MNDELRNALVELREDDVLRIVDRMLDEGADPVAIVETCRSAMEVIGERFACGEAFIPELIMAGEIMTAVATTVRPHLGAQASVEKRGTVVIGTVKGDIHDIGKQIVVTMLDVAGFEVVDLGVDVPPQRFVEAAQESDARVVGLSCLLTQAFRSMKETVAAVADAGLHDSVRIMIGGAPVTASVCEHTGADGYGRNAADAVALASKWTGATDMASDGTGGR